MFVISLIKQLTCDDKFEVWGFIWQRGHLEALGPEFFDDAFSAVVVICRKVKS